MILSKCAICGSKKSRFIKTQEAKGLLSNIGLRTLLRKVPLLGDVLFQLYKTNEIVNKFLLAGDKFMPEMNLKLPAVLGKPGFAYGACGPFTKNKERIQKLKKKNRRYKKYLQK